MTKFKARSRLKHPPHQKARLILIQQKKQLKENTRELRQIVISRWQFIPLLILATLFYIAVYWLLTNIHPIKISNLILPNSYLPFHVLLWLANFFLFTFLTLSKRWGLLIALVIQWLLFLKLQNFNLDWWTWGSALIVGMISCGLRMLWKIWQT